MSLKRSSPQSLFSEEVDISNRIVMWQEGKIRATLHKILNGTEGVIYEDAHASEEGFKAVSILTSMLPV